MHMLHTFNLFDPLPNNHLRLGTILHDGNLCLFD